MVVTIFPRSHDNLGFTSAEVLSAIFRKLKRNPGVASIFVERTNDCTLRSVSLHLNVVRLISLESSDHLRSLHVHVITIHSGTMSILLGNLHDGLHVHDSLLLALKTSSSSHKIIHLVEKRVNVEARHLPDPAWISSGESLLNLFYHEVIGPKVDGRRPLDHSQGTRGEKGYLGGTFALRRFLSLEDVLRLNRTSLCGTSFVFFVPVGQATFVTVMKGMRR